MTLRRSSPTRWSHPWPDRVRAVQDRIGHTFADPSLLEQAACHRSYVNERRAGPAATRLSSNERLEFLGDAVLELVVTEHLYAVFPDRPEGDLSKLRTRLIGTEPLAALARRWALGNLVLLDMGEEKGGGRDKPTILECAVEALVGALYLDGGLEACRHVLGPWLREASERAAASDLRDAKTLLQEDLQAEGHGVPTYRVVLRTGPDNDPTFHMVAELDGDVIGVGAGPSKKKASLGAAHDALLRRASPDRSKPT